MTRYDHHLDSMQKTLNTSIDIADSKRKNEEEGSMVVPTKAASRRLWIGTKSKGLGKFW